MSGRRVKLNIEKLVVQGGGHVDARAIEAAVQQELARLAAERRPGGGARGGWRPDGKLTVKPGASAAEIGAQIARSIHGGMGGGSARG